MEAHLPAVFNAAPWCPGSFHRCREGFVGLSVADTIRQCLRLGLKDQAQKLARDFKACFVRRHLPCIGRIGSWAGWEGRQGP